MITKLAQDLVIGDIFIDPNRAGRRPARVVQRLDMPAGHPGVHVRLSDWTGLADWVSGYGRNEELEIITPEEAMEQTQHNHDEHAKVYMAAMGVTREEYDRRHLAFLESLKKDRI